MLSNCNTNIIFLCFMQGSALFHLTSSFYPSRGEKNGTALQTQTAIYHINFISSLSIFEASEK